MISLGDAILTIKGDTSGLAKAEGEVKSIMGVVKQHSLAIGAAMTGMGAAITGTFGLAVKGATDFGGAMAEVNSLGVKDLAGLRKGAMEAAQSVGGDLNDAAKALYEIISAGVPEGNAVDFLKESAKAAAAGVTDMNTAVDVGTTIVNAFGGTAKDAFDQAFVAVKAGKTTLGELSASLGQLAPVASSAGLSTKEMFGSVAALTLQGIKTSEAMTGMKAVLSNIIKPSSDAADEAERLGINFSLTGLKSKGLEGFLKDLRDKTGGNVESMGKLFGSVEALGSVLALTGRGADAFTGVMKDLASASGATDAAFKKIVESDPGMAWRMLKTDLQVLAVEVGTSIMPMLKSLLDYITPVVKSVIGWVQENPKLSSTLLMIAAGVGAVMTVVGPLIIALPGIVTAFGLLGSATAALTGVGGIGALGIAFGALTGPVGLVAIGIVALTPLIWGVGKAIMGVTEAERQQEESQRKVDAMTNQYIETLKRKGVAIDEVKMKDMSDTEKAQYLTEQRIAAKEKETSSIIRLLTGAEATKQQIFNSELARTALDLNAKQAVFFASKGYTAEQIKDLKQLTDTQKTEIRKQLDAEIDSWKARGATMQNGVKDTDKKTSEMQLYLDRLSLDHHESPSINDHIRASIFGGSGLMATLQSMGQPMGSLLDGFARMWTNTWNGIANYVSQLVEMMKQQYAMNQAVFGYAGGGFVEAHAAGGIVEAHVAGGMTGMATILGGEEGRELAITPDGRAGIIGANGPGLFRLPVGTEISTAAETAHLRLSNVPLIPPDAMMSRGGGAGNTTVSISSPITVSVARLDASNPAEIANLARVISREWETQIQSTLKGRGFRLSTT